MDCVQTDMQSDEEYFRWFNRKVAEHRVPIFGSMDLTHRCNLRCVHCYLRSDTRPDDEDVSELDADQFIRIIDEITAAGCLDLLLTGGEPFLRSDFAAIYRYAKTKGLLVTVFSNGTLITDEIADLFAELPPRAVGISIYGATAETYEKITEVEGSYERCMTGIRRLVDRGIRLDLRTVLMTLNRDEFSDMMAMAEEYGTGFRFDPAIFPRLNGDRSPLDLRVPAEEAVEKECTHGETLRQRRMFFEKMRGVPITEKLYKCSAGLTTFHVDPRGRLRPCIMAMEPQYDLLDGRFATGWQDVISRVRERESPAGFSCNRCERLALCDYCPPFLELEGGAGDPHSEYVCAMAHHRYKAIMGVCKSLSGVGN